MKVRNREITKKLLDALWKQYVERVSYAKTYNDMVLDKGGKVVNDHIAFRTLNTFTGDQPKGIEAIRQILTHLEYEPRGNYKFQQKKLNAIHFEHPYPEFPKIFVSQLEVSEFPEEAQHLINESVKNTPDLLSGTVRDLLAHLGKEGNLSENDAENLVKELTGFFVRPWKEPLKDTVLKLNDLSQYAAWTLLHGNSVNHFTAFINYQDVDEWPDLQSTCNGLIAAGVPMKDTIEGEKGSILQQSSTQAVKEKVEVINEKGEAETMLWTYAYYELAERGYIEENGNRKLFSGFLGEQASQLFEMTRTKND